MDPSTDLMSVVCSPGLWSAVCGRTRKPDELIRWRHQPRPVPENAPATRYRTRAGLSEVSPPGNMSPRAGVEFRSAPGPH
jgi:hypothetical protein